MFFRHDACSRTVNQVDVSLAGKTYTSNQLPSRNIDLNSARSSTNTSVREIPDLFGDGKARPAWVDVVYNNRRIRYATGFVGPFGVQMTRRSPAIVDVLWKLARSPKEACGSGATPIFFAQTSYQDALLMVLHAAGVTDDEMDLASFHLLDDVDPTITAICPIKPICVDVTQNLDSVWHELLAFLGLACFVLPGSGKIHLVKKDARPVASPSLKFSNQLDDIDAGAYAILDPGLDRQIGSFEEVVTVFTASGPPISIDELGTSGDPQDPDAPDWIDPDVSSIALEPVKATWRVIDEETMESGIAPENYDGKAAQMSNQYIQTVPQAEWVAEREGRLACRVEQQYTVPVAFDPGLLPGMSALFKMPEVGFDDWQPGSILAAQSDGLRTNLIVSMGPSEVDGYQVGCPPIADFSILIDAERVVISGEEVVRYFVKVDATTSTDCDGEIVGYDWSVSGAPPLTMEAGGQEIPGTIPSEPVTTMVLNTIENVSITLTVTDDNDPIQNQDSLTQSLTGPLVEVRTRVLSKADDTGGADGTWSVVSNPDVGWKRYTRTGVACLAVPKYNTSGPLASLWADGKLFITEDYLQTEPTAEHSVLPGTSSLLGACFFINEDDERDWLIGTHEADGTGKLWRSLDGGLTWGNGLMEVGTPVQTFSQPVIDCELGNEAGTGYLRVVVGNTTQHSFSNGITWETTATGAADTTGEAFASADWSGGNRHLTVFTGGAAVADTTRWDAGETPTIDWSAIVPPPTELCAVTPGLLAPGKFVTVTPAGKIYILNDDAAGGYTAAVGPLHTTTSQAVRDGIIPDLTFLAAEPAAKLVNDQALYRIDQDTWRSKKIGYGDIIVPAVPEHTETVLLHSSIAAYHWDNPGQDDWIGIIDWTTAGDTRLSQHAVNTYRWDPDTQSGFFVNYTDFSQPEDQGHTRDPDWKPAYVYTVLPSGTYSIRVHTNINGDDPCGLRPNSSGKHSYCHLHIYLVHTDLVSYAHDRYINLTNCDNVNFPTPWETFDFTENCAYIRVSWGYNADWGYGETQTFPFSIEFSFVPQQG